MLGSLYTGSSGVKTQSDAMTVTGANIANVNTIGFKNNRVNFQDLLATSVEGDTGQKIGQGAQIANIQTIHTQGSLENTELETDLAIDGNGFFAVRDKVGKMYYTRAGQFTYDKEGFLTSKNGEYLQVKKVDADTDKTIGGFERIKLKGIVDPPTPTGDGVKEGSGVTMKANLNSNAIPPAMEIDYDNVVPEMYNFSSAVTVIDAKGNEHIVNVAFRKVPDQPAQVDPATNQVIPGTEVKNSWQWIALSPGEDIEGGFTIATYKGVPLVGSKYADKLGSADTDTAILLIAANNVVMKVLHETSNEEVDLGRYDSKGGVVKTYEVLKVKDLTKNVIIDDVAIPA